MKQSTIAFSLALVLAGTAACQGGEPSASKEVNVVVPKASASATASGLSAQPVKPGSIPAPDDVAAAPADAVKETSGLTTKVLTPGTGQERPRDFDSVKVHYSGWTKDGKMFDSSVSRGSPAEFEVGGVIKGWTEGLKLMVTGEKRRFWIPAALAYGEKPSRPGAPSGDLTFDVELLEIKKGVEPPPAPADVAAPPKDATKTKSGLVTKVLAKGTGKDHPRSFDTVKLHFTGWTKDGKMFETTVTRGRPHQAPVSELVKGWGEGVELMVVGEKRRLWIPQAIAFGEMLKMGAPAGDITMDVELLEITKGSEPPPVPKDLAKPPADAKKTKSGLTYRVLTKGKGKDHPTATSRVSVHYSGWSKDGKMFDSSVTRGQPATFPLNGVIKGWTEGVQLMVKGDKVRFWIPADLAYGEKPSRPGAPSGELVFDVELLDIQ
ncbi:MAG: FKBP-type peptidyl-prolyl cis-trans isomerase [Deltaproteobacteria bacterium]|nr:FKBP-type peptidyl-prolyl cis-trans isomerase [Deltaproteobacteria bacterium]